MAALSATCGSSIFASSSSSLSSSTRALPPSSLFLQGKPLRLPLTHPGSPTLPLLPVRATTSTEEKVTTETSAQAEDLIADLKAKWDATENKSTIIVYGAGALVALWLSSTIVGAVNSVPLLPKVLELVGLGYTGWFVYRYLLFKESRKELVADIEELKSKIAGAGKD